MNEQYNQAQFHADYESRMTKMEVKVESIEKEQDVLKNDLKMANENTQELKLLLRESILSSNATNQAIQESNATIKESNKNLKELIDSIKKENDTRYVELKEANVLQDQKIQDEVRHILYKIFGWAIGIITVLIGFISTYIFIKK